jgi:hypothetical protein
MKVPTKLLGILAVIIFLAAATGCDSGNGSNNQALTEIDFANNPSLQADPDNQTIVDFLESPSSDTPQYDTGPVGIDEIPITYPQTETHTFCWTDDNSEAMDYMVLLDSQGEEVLRVDVNGDCVTDTIEAGDYVMELHHDGSTGDPLPIFISTNQDQNQQTMKTDGFFNGFKVVIARILRGIQSTISKDARAQTPNHPFVILLTTNSCQGCDLFKANLYHVNLTGADLRKADLRRADLNGATLVGADLRGADLRNTNFFGAKLTDIKLIIEQYCRLKLVNKDGTLQCYGNPETHPQAKPKYFIRQAAGAIFNKATWCDGETICRPPSLGTCCYSPKALENGCLPRLLPGASTPGFPSPYTPACASLQIVTMP